MHGRIIQIKNNNLSDIAEGSQIMVYACLKNLKYSDTYILFSYKNKNEDKDLTLYYGSVFFNPDTIVILEVKKDIEKDILNIANSLMDNTPIKGYDILSIDSNLKAEIVSKNSIEFNEEQLIKLEKSCIKKEEENKKINEKNRKKNSFKIFLIILIVIGGIVAYFYFINKSNYKLYCESNYANNEISANINDVIIVLYDKDDKIRYLDREVKYIFITKLEYSQFKTNTKLQNEIIDSADAYKAVDSENTFIAYTRKTNLTNSYDSLKEMYETKGYVCKKVKDNE